MMSLLRFCVASLLLAFAATGAVAQESPGFKYDNQVYSGEKLPTSLQQRFYELEVELNQQRRQALDAYAIERYMEDRAKSEKRTVDQVRNELFAVPEPDSKMIEEFYEANKERIPGSLEQMRGQIAEYLINQQRQARVLAVLDQLKKEKGYEAYLAEPVAPVMDVTTEGYPFKGNANAKVTIVEFADYQCPHCKNAVPVMRSLLERYGDKLRVVYRDFPINRSGISRKVAEGAVCAGEQGRFWDFHDLAFERQSYLAAITPKDLAEELKLDVAKFEACIGREETRAKVTASFEEGKSFGITGTPAFYVNGRKLNVQSDLEAELAAAIDRALAM